ncbi:MAG: hypothetical protein ACYC3X_28825 [Pirellulaceae bacterium]
MADSIHGPWVEMGNPCVGSNAEKTFLAQSTFVFPVAGKSGEFIFMADRWNNENLSDSRYVWLPVRFTSTGICLEWLDEWELSTFGGGPRP